jgi:hypothetical protein
MIYLGAIGACGMHFSGSQVRLFLGDWFWIDFHRLLLRHFFLPDYLLHAFREFKGWAFEVVGAMLLGCDSVVGGGRVPPSLGLHGIGNIG